MQDFFKKLKELREKSPFTQQQIADKLGISIKQYQNYEVKTIPPHEKLLKLNEIFKCDLSKIIYQEKVGGTSNEEDEKIQNKYLEYKEKYMTALEEIRELQKKLLGEKGDLNADKPSSLKRAK